MATQAYYDWVAAGRPWRLVRPVYDVRRAFIAAGWPAGAIGTIGDETHLQADRPQDHTPFSVTGWPVTHPYPYVTAIDVSHGGVRESALDDIVLYWIEQAEEGLTPWVKYITYKGFRVDVRNGWTPVTASGHYDHAHVSMRSDHVDTTIGDWKVIGERPIMGDTQVGRDVWGQTIGSPALNYHQPAGEWLKYVLSTARDVEGLKTALTALTAVVRELAERPPADVNPAELGAALAGNPAFVDAIATAVSSRLGMIPTAGEIARAIGELDWHGSVR